MKTEKIFKNGQSQAVHLPKEFHINDKEVFIKKVGEIIMLIPKHNIWGAFYDGLTRFSDDFLESRDQPTQQERGNIF